MDVESERESFTIRHRAEDKENQVYHVSSVVSTNHGLDRGVIKGDKMPASLVNDGTAFC